MKNNDTDFNKEFKELVLDFKNYAFCFLKIKTKKSQIVPLVLNPVQMALVDYFLWCIANGVPIKVIILKARQMGVSTAIVAFIFWLTHTNYNVKATVVGHIADASTNLFNMYRRYLDNLPPAMRPVIERDNVKGMKFKELGSEMRVLTAEGGEIGRSDQYQILHLTEKAFWSDAEKASTSIMQTLSDTGYYFDESTANGIGGLFHSDWVLANLGEGHKDWNGMKPFFFAWYDLPEYTKPFVSEEEEKELIRTMDEDERELYEEQGVSLEQLNWRRATLKFKCRGSLNVFKQEYPSNETEAFLTSGRPVFQVDICDSMFKAYESFRPKRYDLVNIADSNGKIRVERRPNPNGLWFFFEDVAIDPREINRFAIGTDVAEGLEQGDYSSSDVFDRKTGRYPIKFHGHIPPDLLAREQLKLQIYLGGVFNVLFTTERNNNGLVTVYEAENIGVSQSNQGSIENGYEISRATIGFKTTSVTKPLIISRLGEAIREQNFIDKDSKFWKETLTFVDDGKGGMSAQGKKKGEKVYDDRVISKALSLEAHTKMGEYGMRVEFKGKNKGNSRASY